MKSTQPSGTYMVATSPWRTTLGGPRRQPGGQGRLLLLVAVVPLIAGLGALPLQTAAAPTSPDHDVSGLLEIPSGLTTTGNQVTTTGLGALHFADLRDQGTLHFQAAHVELNYSWERGYDAKINGESLGVKPVVDHGAKSLEMDNVTIEVAPRAPGTEALLFNTGSETDLGLRTAVASTYGTVEDRVVAATGSSPDNQRAREGNSTGFWFKVEGPWVGVQSHGRPSATGSFGLFVNNATVTISGSEGSWRNWTGRDSTTSPAWLSSYDLRVAVMRLSDARLVGGSDRDAEIYGPTVTTHVDGSISAAKASGDLLIDEQRLGLQQAPLRLDGTGRLVADAFSPANLGKTSGDEASPSIRLRTHGDFAVSAPGLTPTSPAAGTELPELWTPWVAASIGLVGILALGVRAGTHGEPPFLTVAPRWSSAGRERLVEQAERLEHEGKYSRAADVYAAAARREGGDLTLVYEHARLRYEAGEHETALEVLAGVQDGFGRVPTDLLELEVAAAWEAGLEPEAERALKELHGTCPAEAEEVVRAMDLEPLAEQLGLRFGDDRRERWEEDLDGYV